MKKSLKIILCLAGVATMASCNGTTNPSNGSLTPSTSNSTVVTPELKAEEEVSLTVGQTHKIVFTKLVGIEASSIQYSSRDESVATVAADGTITAVDEGETTIIVRAGDLRSSVTVKVSDPNKLQGLVKYSKLKNIAKMTENQFAVLKDDEMINFAWGAKTSLEDTAAKVDFTGEAEDSTVIGRGAAIKDHASYWNGGWVVAFQSNGEELKDVSVEDYRKLGLGFRDIRLYETTKMILENKVDLQKLRENPDTKEVREQLLTLSGVGPKVADCILLFSDLKRFEVFPIDVWVRRVMNDLYIKEEDETKVSKVKIEKIANEKFGNLAGLAQQYLFYWRRMA